MQGLSYAVDIVLCIDKTGSMEPIIDAVKTNALKFESDLQKFMVEKGRPVDKLRVRVIAFGDIYHDKGNWLKDSDFIPLPERKEEFRAFVDSIKAEGGGDEPENALEALALATNSAWTKEGDKRRHLVVIWTDTTAHPLELRSTRDASAAKLPSEMPSTLGGLIAMWNDPQKMSKTDKRVVVFAPDADPWSNLYEELVGMVHVPTRAGHGMSELDYQQVLEQISNSL